MQVRRWWHARWRDSLHRASPITSEWAICTLSYAGHSAFATHHVSLAHQFPFWKHATAVCCVLSSFLCLWLTWVKDPLRRGSGEPPALRSGGSPPVPLQAGSERRRCRRSRSRSCAAASSSSACFGSDSRRALPSRRGGPWPPTPWAPAHPPEASSAGCSPSGAEAGLPCSVLLMEALPVALNLPTCGRHNTRSAMDGTVFTHTAWPLAAPACAAERRVHMVSITVTAHHGTAHQGTCQLGGHPRSKQVAVFRG